MAFLTFVMYSLVPVSSRMIFCSSLGVHWGWTACSIIHAMISHGIFGGLPLLEIPEAVKASGIEAFQPGMHPPIGPHKVGCSLTYAHFAHADHVYGKHLRITLESFSFLYAFSNSSRFVASMTWLYGRGSLLLSIW